MHGVPNSSVQPTPGPPPVRCIIGIPLTRSQIVAGLQPERGIVAGVQPELGVLLDVREVELRDPTNGGPGVVIYCRYTTPEVGLGILCLEVRAGWTVQPADLQAGDDMQPASAG